MSLIKRLSPKSIGWVCVIGVDVAWLACVNVVVANRGTCLIPLDGSDVGSGLGVGLGMGSSGGPAVAAPESLLVRPSWRSHVCSYLQTWWCSLVPRSSGAEWCKWSSPGWQRTQQSRWSRCHPPGWRHSSRPQRFPTGSNTTSESMSHPIPGMVKSVRARV